MLHFNKIILAPNILGNFGSDGGVRQAIFGLTTEAPSLVFRESLVKDRPIKCFLQWVSFLKISTGNVNLPLSMADI